MRRANGGSSSGIASYLDNAADHVAGGGRPGILLLAARSASGPRFALGSLRLGSFQLQRPFWVLTFRALVVAKA